jgi:hypothetical protein
MSDQTDREAKLREIAKERMVYTLPGMDGLPVRRDLSYRATSGTLLPFDIYYPATPPGQRVPVVLIPLAYPDPLAGVRAFGPFTSVAQLVAASGMAAVLYGSEAPAEDVHALLGHLRAEAAALDLDATRPGLIAMSGNATVALSTLMRDGAMACAALLCGYTMDLDVATAVGDMARQYGFADACAGKSVDDLPSDVPMLLVRAGRDDSPGLNDAFDRVVTRALARNLPLTLVNYAAGTHRFVWDDDSAISHEIVRQVLAFLAFHLK